MGLATITMKRNGVGEGRICTVTNVCYEMVVFDMCFICIENIGYMFLFLLHNTTDKFLI